MAQASGHRLFSKQVPSCWSGSLPQSYSQTGAGGRREDKKRGKRKRRGREDKKRGKRRRGGGTTETIGVAKRPLDDSLPLLFHVVSH